MASPFGHSSRAQLYKRCSARGWPNKILAQRRSSFALCLSRRGKQLNQGFETLCSAYTEFVLSFLFQSSHISHVFAQNCHSSSSRVGSEEKIGSSHQRENKRGPSWQIPKLTYSEWKTVKTAPPHPGWCPSPSTALQPWSVPLNLTGHLKYTFQNRNWYIHP